MKHATTRPCELKKKEGNWGCCVVDDVNGLCSGATVVGRWRRELAVDASWRAFEQGFKVQVHAPIRKVGRVILLRNSSTTRMAKV
jgi:hypothetical protein